jgi:hypothetical protein
MKKFWLLIFGIIVILVFYQIFKKNSILREEFQNFGDRPLTDADLPIGSPGAVYSPNVELLGIAPDESEYMNYFNYYYPYDIFKKKFKGQKLYYGRQLYSNLFLI